MPIILGQIQIRRTMASTMIGPNGKLLRIGASIPHYNIKTVELAFS
jgi:hypothetical protein